jgi:DNA-binding transcriptional ArsR family regulator
MPTSRSTPKLVTDLCWGAWSELGVSGWGRTHEDWAIDPEPLIVFTSSIGADDPRLRDEAMDWCIRNWRHVSLTRLRNALRSQGELNPDSWGKFAAVVNARAGVNWPGATTECSTYRVTGRSVLHSLSDPSLVYLRMRAMFGVSARTEILRVFLLHPRSKRTASALAEATGYTKRNVAEACDLLVQAGVLTAKTVGNRFYYSLREVSPLAAFVGPIPEIAPDWNALFRVVGAIRDLSDMSEEASADALIVETHQVARNIEEDLDLLGIEGPRRLRGARILDQWDEWSAEVITDLASGTWPTEEAEAQSSVSAIPTGAARRTRISSRQRVPTSN